MKMLGRLPITTESLFSYQVEANGDVVFGAKEKLPV